MHCFVGSRGILGSQRLYNVMLMLTQRLNGLL
jgi:hypothetical protein